MKTIEYFLAPASPYVYLGHQRLLEIARRHKARIELKPIDLGGKVFPISGGLPVGQRPQQRQAYRLVELVRWPKYLNLPFNIKPKFVPVAGDAAALLIIAADQLVGNEAALAVAQGVFSAVWAHERNIADPATLIEIAKQAGCNGEQLLDSAAAMQPLYETYTQQAIALHVFGAPWYVYNHEPFWGQDRLDFLDRALAGA
jgi:2-hydroxychromene-2-carboxylate isomerase